MVDQKTFKTAKKYGFDSVYFDECSMDMIEKYMKYIRPLLTPTCEYVLVNRKGKQFQKLTELFSVLVFEAIGKYIHPTRYRQITETQSCEIFLPSEQKWISEDQKHSSNVACVHYQKERSREVAMRGRWCMQKLLEENKSMENECERVDESRPIENSVNPTNSAEKLLARRGGIRFTTDEDNHIRLGIKKFGLRWLNILRDPEFHFNSCRVPNTLRKRAEALKLV